MEGNELRKLAEAVMRNPGSTEARVAFTSYERIAAILALLDDNAALRNENDRLRAALAQSDQPCAYCSLPRDEWEKCQHGFPGCSRADDAMGCPELGARMEADALRKRVEELEGALRQARYWIAPGTDTATKTVPHPSDQVKIIDAALGGSQ